MVHYTQTNAKSTALVVGMGMFGWCYLFSTALYGGVNHLNSAVMLVSGGTIALTTWTALTLFK